MTQRIHYKRALFQLAPLVGGDELLTRPWLVLDRAREEIERLRAEVKELKGSDSSLRARTNERQAVQDVNIEYPIHRPIAIASTRFWPRKRR